MNETNAKPRLSASEVRELLVRAVEEKGADYVYRPHKDVSGPTCRYMHNGQPDCIVGHVAYYVGVRLPETGSARTVVPVHIDVDRTTLSALGEAQTVQDSFRPWGEALAAFDAALAGES